VIETAGSVVDETSFVLGAALPVDDAVNAGNDRCGAGEARDETGGLASTRSQTLVFSGVGGIVRARMKQSATTSATVEKPRACMMIG
jgi:hypothetical protein